MNLVGNDELHSDEQLRGLWKESMKSVNCTTAHIAYDQFLLLMKGQTKEPELPPPSSARMASLGSVPEGGSVVEEHPEFTEEAGKGPNSLPPRVANLGEPEVHLIDPTANEDWSLNSLPNMTSPAMYESSGSSIGLSGSPGLDSPLISKVVSEEPSSEIPVLAEKKPGIITRGRSKSLAEESESSNDSPVPSFRGDSRIALSLPERDPKVNQELAKNQSALSVSRQLYRAHRQMRLSVMEASRRFEEEQARRARDALMAQKAKEAGMMGLGQAGLVMRHGHKVQVTTDAIRQYLEDYKAEQQELVEKATRRGGRGRGNRKKTISDMSAMMNPSLGQDELAGIVAKAVKTPQTAKETLNASLSDFGLSDFGVPDLKMPVAAPFTAMAPHPPGPHATPPVGPTKAASVAVIETGPSVRVVDKSLRKATVPGQFHQTKDPFRSDGMYGGARISLVDVNQIKSTANTKN
jgi:hypothetical protein